MFLFNSPNSWETTNSFLVKKAVILTFLVKALIYREHDKFLPDAALHASKQHRLNGLKLLSQETVQDWESLTLYKYCIIDGLMDEYTKFS